MTGNRNNRPPDEEALIKMWRRQRLRSLSFTTLLLLFFFAFVFSLSHYGRWLAVFVMPHVTLAMAFAAFLIVLSLALTWLYARKAP